MQLPGNARPPCRAGPTATSPGLFSLSLRPVPAPEEETRLAVGRPAVADVARARHRPGFAVSGAVRRSLHDDRLRRAASTGHLQSGRGYVWPLDGDPADQVGAVTSYSVFHPLTVNFDFHLPDANIIFNLVRVSEDDASERPCLKTCCCLTPTPSTPVVFIYSSLPFNYITNWTDACGSVNH